MAAMALALCAVGCRASAPACFKVDSGRAMVPLRTGGEETRIFEAFVMAHPPRAFEDLRAAVEQSCGRLPAATPAYSVQWWVFEETSRTPRTLVPGAGKHDGLDAHQDDLILDVNLRVGSGCVDAIDYVQFRGGDPVARHRVELPRAADAGPPPAWCGR
ncbi:MAG TPA: hypothetical protein VE964_18510 [Myxococcales bacterium]|nr:hypothetical protein [Myxococcales bacterium]